MYYKKSLRSKINKEKLPSCVLNLDDFLCPLWKFLWIKCKVLGFQSQQSCRRIYIYPGVGSREAPVQHRPSPNGFLLQPSFFRLRFVKSFREQMVFNSQMVGIFWERKKRWLRLVISSPPSNVYFPLTNGRIGMVCNLRNRSKWDRWGYNLPRCKNLS